MTTGEQLKQAGMAQAAQNRAVLLEEARNIALVLAATNGQVTADDISEKIRINLGPASGSIFKTPDFEFTGQRVASKLKSNHARELKVWRLTPSGKIKSEKVQVQKHTTAERSPPITPEPVRSPAPTPLPSWLR